MPELCLRFAVFRVNPLSTNSTKWSNTLKQFVGNLPTNCLSVLDHFMRLALKGLSYALFKEGYIMSLSYVMSELSYIRSKVAMFKLFYVKVNFDFLTQNVGIKLWYTCKFCYT